MPLNFSPPPAPKPRPGELLAAVVDNNIATVRRLLKQGADPNEADGLGNSVLCRAATYAYTDILRALLEAGANPDSRNAQGNTPLMLSIMSYSPDREIVARLLLDKDANLDIKNNRGETAMAMAVNMGRVQMIKMLNDTAATRKRLADEFARATIAKQRAEIAEKQRRLKELAKKRGPKPPLAA